MLLNLKFDPHQIKDNTCVAITSKGSLNGFPFISIDADSYMIGTEIHSGIDQDISSGRHCIAIGKGCSLALSTAFVIDINHNYASVYQGEISFLKEIPTQNRIRRKASIIIQNDVWIGWKSMIMAGVTLHNGCIVGAGTLVTKDVPPYAVVGGNPARILRYRFEPDIIDGLQKIAWWDWPRQLIISRKEDFALPPREFVKKYLPEAEKELQAYKIVPSPRADTGSMKTVLFIPDFSEPFPLYRKILSAYFSMDRPKLNLLIYLPASESTAENLRILESILQQYEQRNCDVILQTGEDMDEHVLFQYADYFITTRSKKTVYRTCLADLYQTKILYGTDEPIFYE